MPCFSCERHPQKYVTGLCEACHQISMKIEFARRQRIARTPLFPSEEQVRASQDKAKGKIYGGRSGKNYRSG